MHETARLPYPLRLQFGLAFRYIGGIPDIVRNIQASPAGAGRTISSACPRDTHQGRAEHGRDTSGILQNRRILGAARPRCRSQVRKAGCCRGQSFPKRMPAGTLSHGGLVGSRVNQPSTVFQDIARLSHSYTGRLEIWRVGHVSQAERVARARLTPPRQ